MKAEQIVNDPRTIIKSEIGNLKEIKQRSDYISSTLGKMESEIKHLNQIT